MRSYEGCVAAVNYENVILIRNSQVHCNCYVNAGEVNCYDEIDSFWNIGTIYFFTYFIKTVEYFMFFKIHVTVPQQKFVILKFHTIYLKYTCFSPRLELSHWKWKVYKKLPSGHTLHWPLVLYINRNSGESLSFYADVSHISIVFLAFIACACIFLLPSGRLSK